MKLSEFYEKYWKVQNKKGEMIPPPALNNVEKEFLDNPDYRNHVLFSYRARRGPLQIDIKSLYEEMKSNEKM